MNSIISKGSIEKTITIKNGKEVVRSDNLAKMFEKQHKHVLEKIKSTIAEAEFSTSEARKYFIEEVVSKPQGGRYIRYYLTRKGFDLIALSLTGKNALKYKIWYIDSFHDKQELIKEHKLTAKLNNSDDLWVQFREEGKEFRNKLTKAIHDTIVVYREQKEQKMNDGKYYYHYTSLIYKKLGINLPKAVNPRDVLDKRTLVRLEDMEDNIANKIEEYSKDLHYKDVYKKIKEELQL